MKAIHCLLITFSVRFGEFSFATRSRLYFDDGSTVAFKCGIAIKYAGAYRINPSRYASQNGIKIIGQEYKRRGYKFENIIYFRATRYPLILSAGRSLFTIRTTVDNRYCKVHYFDTLSMPMVRYTYVPAMRVQ